MVPILYLGMQQKTWPYGTTYDVIVEKSDEKMILVVAKSINEGFILMGHGLKGDDLPAPKSSGKIVFTKGGPKGGYWVWQK